MRGQGVSAARQIAQAAGSVRVGQVVGRVVQPTQGQCRAALIAFAGVIEDHIEQHLDAGCMQPLDRVDHGCNALRAGQRCLHCKEGDRVVAPVVAQAALNQMQFIDPGGDRQQLHCGDTQALQMGDRSRVCQGFDRAAARLRDARVQLAEAAHMHLVQDRLAPGATRLGQPVTQCVNRRAHTGLGHIGGAVSRIERVAAVGMAGFVAQDGIVPLQRADQFAGIGIDQQLVRIEAMAQARLIGAMRAITIDRPCNCTRQAAMKDVAAASRQLVSGEFPLAIGIKQAHFDALRMV